MGPVAGIRGLPQMKLLPSGSPMRAVPEPHFYGQHHMIMSFANEAKKFLRW